MKKLTAEEALRQFPFIAQVAARVHPRDGLRDRSLEAAELLFTDFDEAFRGRSLLEDESLRHNSNWVHISLYVVRNDQLSEVSVRRTKRELLNDRSLQHGPHPGPEELPDDEYGWSETMLEALDREGMGGVQYVILHERGTSCGSSLKSMGLADKAAADFNRIIIASL